MPKINESTLLSVLASLDVPGVDKADIERIVQAAAQHEAQAKANAVQAKAEAQATAAVRKDFTQKVVNAVTGGPLARQTFQTGAEGWNLGGTFVGVDGQTYKVQILLRDAATIPA